MNKYLPEESLKENNLITQSIYLVESSYKLKTVEQKILLTLISQIQPTDQDFVSYYFKVKDFAEFLNVTSNNMYKELINNTESIMKRVIRIKNKLTGDVILTHWVQKAVYHKKKGMIEIQFDPGLKPYLLNLKNQFVSYSIQNIIGLKSFYSIRIYELLKQYQKIGSRTFTVDHLKEMLGIDSDDYQLYGHFKNKVIQKAVQEINLKTDIFVDFEERKEGKKVYQLVFTVKKNADFTPQKGDNKKDMFFKKGVLDVQSFLVDAVGLGLQESEDLIKKHGNEFLLECANKFADHKKVIDRKTIKDDFLSLIKEYELNQHNSFVFDNDYLDLEKAAKDQPDYENRKIFYLMEIMKEFENVKNNTISLQEAILKIKNAKKM